MEWYSQGFMLTMQLYAGHKESSISSDKDVKSFEVGWTYEAGFDLPA